MTRGTRQLQRQVLAGFAVLLIGGLLWAGEIALLTWIAERISPGSVERDGDTIRIHGTVGVIANTLIFLGFVLIAGIFLRTIFFWRYRCPECGALARLSGRQAVFLECTVCSHREPTEAHYE